MPNIYDLWQGPQGSNRGPQGVIGVTGDNMGPLVRSHDDYRHPRSCLLPPVSWYVRILKIYGQIYGPNLSGHKSDPVPKMAISYTLWTSASNILKSEPSCTSHKPRASLQSWQVWWGLVHRKCPHAATQSYACWLVHWNQACIAVLVLTLCIRCRRCTNSYRCLWCNMPARIRLMNWKHEANCVSYLESCGLVWVMAVTTEMLSPVTCWIVNSEDRRQID